MKNNIKLIVKYFFIFTLFTLFVNCKSTSKNYASRNAKFNKNSIKGNYRDYGDKKQLIDKIIKKASENIGIKYKAGGTTKEDGFDCSGLIFSTLKNFNIKIPRVSRDMSKIGETIAIDKIRKGDLLFFKTDNKNTITHVGLVTEILNDEILFIHSSSSSGVVISSTKEPYFDKTFCQANRVF